MSTTEVEPVQAGPYTRYGLYSAPITHAEAAEKYKGNPYALADIPDEEIKRVLADLLPDSIKGGWIGAWKGDHYGGKPLALFKNGNIVIDDTPGEKLGTFVMWVVN